MSPFKLGCLSTGLVGVALLGVFLRPSAVEQAQGKGAHDSDKPVVRLRFGKPRELERAAKEYIAKHGMPAFMDEYYNLVGTREKTTFTADNVTLGRALGLELIGKALPVTAPKRAVLAVLPESRVLADRRFLASWFADEHNLPTLGRAQRSFLEWYFLAPRNCASNLEKSTGEVVVGWNSWAEVADLRKAVFYGFGVVGCTAVFAVSPDGAGHSSHYDFVVNRTQLYVLNDFLARHPKARLFFVGSHAKRLARFLRATNKIAAIYVHEKDASLETTYSLRFTQSDGEPRLTYCETPISSDFLLSLHNKRYSLWFSYGRFSQMYPPLDDAFVELPFEEFKSDLEEYAAEPFVYSRAGGTLYPGEFTAVERFWLERGETTPRHETIR